MRPVVKLLSPLIIIIIIIIIITEMYNYKLLLVCTHAANVTFMPCRSMRSCVQYAHDSFHYWRYAIKLDVD